MKFLLASILLAFVASASSLSNGFKIHMKEGQVEYDQTMAYNQPPRPDLGDADMFDVITHVPAHTRDNITLHEVIKIENKLLGVAVWRLMDKDFCHIEKMEPERDPTGMMLEAVSYEARKKVMDIVEVTSVYVHAKFTGQWWGDWELLTRDMKFLCNGLPIKLVGGVNISKEEFDNFYDGEDRRMVAPSAYSNVIIIRGTIIHRTVVSDSDLFSL